MPTNRETNKPNGSAHGGNGAAYPAGHVESASGLFSGIQQKVTSRVDAQKNRAADGLGGIADVIRAASDELRMDNETLASYVDMASDQMRRVANQIRERGVADMMDDVSAFARRRPAVFIGGAFLLGIGLARFLKASSERDLTAGTETPSYSGDLGESGSY